MPTVNKYTSPKFHFTFHRGQPCPHVCSCVDYLYSAIIFRVILDSIRSISLQTFLQFNVLSFIVAVISIILIVLPLLTTYTMAYGGAHNCEINIGQLVDKSEITAGLSIEASQLFGKWFIAMFIVPLGIVCTVTFCLVAYMHAVVHYQFLGLLDKTASSHIMQSINSVLYYPIILIIFWGPVIINFFLMGNLAANSRLGHGEAIRRVLGTYCWSSM
jgi:hypothetical protein